LSSDTVGTKPCGPRVNISHMRKGMVMNRLPWSHAKAVDMGFANGGCLVLAVVVLAVVAVADAVSAQEVGGTKSTVGTANIMTRPNKKQFGEEMLTKMHDAAGNSQSRPSDRRKTLFHSEGVLSSPLVLFLPLSLYLLLLGIKVMCDHSSAQSTWTH
jgi:hypothetical protein